MHASKLASIIENFIASLSSFLSALLWLMRKFFIKESELLDFVFRQFGVWVVNQIFLFSTFEHHELLRWIQVISSEKAKPALYSGHFYYLVKTLSFYHIIIIIFIIIIIVISTNIVIVLNHE